MNRHLKELAIRKQLKFSIARNFANLKLIGHDGYAIANYVNQNSAGSPPRFGSSAVVTARPHRSEFLAALRANFGL